MSDSTFLLLLGAVCAVAIAKVAYDAGYRRGREDVLDPPHLRPLTEDQRNKLLMRLTLPSWRRWAGWAAIAVPTLAFWVLMWAVMRYGSGSGWWILAAVIGSFVLLGLGSWLSDRFWKPFRDAQERERRSRLNKDST
jgi:hypothetical protein